MYLQKLLKKISVSCCIIHIFQDEAQPLRLEAYEIFCSWNG